LFLKNTPSLICYITNNAVFFPPFFAVYAGEENYGHSNMVVEFHNTWSSLAFLSLFGIIGLWKGNPTKEVRHSLAYFVLFMIGIGSAGLHGSLHWIFQSSDGEKIYLMCTRTIS
jgi:hypothetical protein